VRERKVETDAVIMLNITGGGIGRYRREHRVVQQQPVLTFPVDARPEEVKRELELLQFA